ncbi:MAG: guanylate kinase [Oscillospiraceae bacterium]|nr:guanylate kinase [Oscillospiraceae bacterium]
MNKGLLIVFSGPSGCGKGTCMEALLAADPEIALSVSATTRAPRPAEIDGVHYHFVTREQFLEGIETGDMLEYAEYNNCFYGTPASAVERQLAEGKVVFLEIEVQGALKVRQKCPEAVMIFLMPPSKEELRRRLEKRSTNTPEDIQRRLKIAEDEMSVAPEYDYIVYNNALEDAVDDIRAIIRAERCRTERQLSDR